MAALGHADDAPDFRDRLVKAMQAEGVRTSCWQKFILPAMTVFRARNAYGRGCPWSCPHAAPPPCDPADYPVAARHADTHAGMTTPLRAPNAPDAADLTARGIRKVMANLDQVEQVE